MQKTKIFVVSGLIFLAVIIAGFGSWYIYRDLTKKNDGSSNGLGENKSENKIVVPNLDKEIFVAAGVSEETKKTATAKIKEIIAVLKQDYDKREEWLNLGIWRKILGDYEGAKEAWEFVTVIRPNDAVAYHNLGDLYSQYLADFEKAEKNYLLAIEKEPKTSFYYVKLFEFYRYFAKKPDLAEDILKQGIQATNDSALQTILDDYKNER